MQGGHECTDCLLVTRQSFGEDDKKSVEGAPRVPNRASWFPRSERESEETKPIHTEAAFSAFPQDRHNFLDECVLSRVDEEIRVDSKGSRKVTSSYDPLRLSRLPESPQDFR